MPSRELVVCSLYTEHGRKESPKRKIMLCLSDVREDLNLVPEERKNITRPFILVCFYLTSPEALVHGFEVGVFKLLTVFLMYLFTETLSRAALCQLMAFRTVHGLIANRM